MNNKRVRSQLKFKGLIFILAIVMLLSTLTIFLNTKTAQATDTDWLVTRTGSAAYEDVGAPNYYDPFAGLFQGTLPSTTTLTENADGTIDLSFTLSNYTNYFGVNRTTSQGSNCHPGIIHSNKLEHTYWATAGNLKKYPATFHTFIKLPDPANFPITNVRVDYWVGNSGNYEDTNTKILGRLKAGNIDNTSSSMIFTNFTKLAQSSVRESIELEDLNKKDQWRSDKEFVTLSSIPNAAKFLKLEFATDVSNNYMWWARERTAIKIGNIKVKLTIGKMLEIKETSVDQEDPSFDIPNISTTPTNQNKQFTLSFLADKRFYADPQPTTAADTINRIKDSVYLIKQGTTTPIKIINDATNSADNIIRYYEDDTNKEKQVIQNLKYEISDNGTYDLYIKTEYGYEKTYTNVLQVSKIDKTPPGVLNNADVTDLNGKDFSATDAWYKDSTAFKVKNLPSYNPAADDETKIFMYYKLFKKPETGTVTTTTPEDDPSWVKVETIDSTTPYTLNDDGADLSTGTWELWTVLYDEAGNKGTLNKTAEIKIDNEIPNGTITTEYVSSGEEANISQWIKEDIKIIFNDDFYSNSLSKNLKYSVKIGEEETLLTEQSDHTANITLFTLLQNTVNTAQPFTGTYAITLKVTSITGIQWTNIININFDNETPDTNSEYFEGIFGTGWLTWNNGLDDTYTFVFEGFEYTDSKVTDIMLYGSYKLEYLIKNKDGQPLDASGNVDPNAEYKSVNYIGIASIATDSFSINFPKVAGEYKVSFKITDQVGNESVLDDLTAKIDPTKYTLTYTDEGIGNIVFAGQDINNTDTVYFYRGQDVSLRHILNADVQDHYRVRKIYLDSIPQVFEKEFSNDKLQAQGNVNVSSVYDFANIAQSLTIKVDYVRIVYYNVDVAGVALDISSFEYDEQQHNLTASIKQPETPTTQLPLIDTTAFTSAIYQNATAITSIKNAQNYILVAKLDTTSISDGKDYFSFDDLNTRIVNITPRQVTISAENVFAKVGSEYKNYITFEDALPTFNIDMSTVNIQEPGHTLSITTLNLDVTDDNFYVVSATEKYLNVGVYSFKLDISELFVKDASDEKSPNYQVIFDTSLQFIVNKKEVEVELKDDIQLIYGDKVNAANYTNYFKLVTGQTMLGDLQTGSTGIYNIFGRYDIKDYSILQTLPVGEYVVQKGSLDFTVDPGYTVNYSLKVVESSTYHLIINKKDIEIKLDDSFAKSYYGEDIIDLNSNRDKVSFVGLIAKDEAANIQNSFIYEFTTAAKKGFDSGYYDIYVHVDESSIQNYKVANVDTFTAKYYIMPYEITIKPKQPASGSDLFTLNENYNDYEVEDTNAPAGADTWFSNVFILEYNFIESLDRNPTSIFDADGNATVRLVKNPKAKSTNKNYSFKVSQTNNTIVLKKGTLDYLKLSSESEQFILVTDTEEEFIWRLAQLKFEIKFVGEDKTALIPSSLVESYAFVSGVDYTTRGLKTIQFNNLNLNIATSKTVDIAMKLNVVLAADTDIALTKVYDKQPISEKTLTKSITHTIAPSDTITINITKVEVDQNMINVGEYYPIVTYTCADQYVILDFSNSMATITPKELTFDTTKSISTKVYDKTNKVNPLVAEGLTGVVTGDNIILQIQGTYASSDAGTNIAVTVTDYKLIGDNPFNYTFKEPTSAVKGVIIGKEITADISQEPFLSGAITAATFGDYVRWAGVISGDESTLSPAFKYKQSDGSYVALTDAHFENTTTDTVSVTVKIESVNSNYLMSSVIELVVKVLPDSTTTTYTIHKKDTVDFVFVYDGEGKLVIFDNFTFKDKDDVIYTPTTSEQSTFTVKYDGSTDPKVMPGEYILDVSIEIASVTYKQKFVMNINKKDIYLTEHSFITEYTGLTNATLIYFYDVEDGCIEADVTAGGKAIFSVTEISKNPGTYNVSKDKIFLQPSADLIPYNFILADEVEITIEKRLLVGNKITKPLTGYKYDATEFNYNNITIDHTNSREWIGGVEKIDFARPLTYSEIVKFASSLDIELPDWFNSMTEAEKEFIYNEAVLCYANAKGYPVFFETDNHRILVMVEITKKNITLDYTTTVEYSKVTQEFIDKNAKPVIIGLEDSDQLQAIFDFEQEYEHTKIIVTAPAISNTSPVGTYAVDIDASKSINFNITVNKKEIIIAPLKLEIEITQNGQATYTGVEQTFTNGSGFTVSSNSITLDNGVTYDVNGTFVNEITVKSKDSGWVEYQLPTDKYFYKDQGVADGIGSENIVVVTNSSFIIKKAEIEINLTNRAQETDPADITIEYMDEIDFDALDIIATLLSGDETTAATKQEILDNLKNNMSLLFKDYLYNADNEQVQTDILNKPGTYTYKFDSIVGTTKNYIFKLSQTQKLIINKKVIELVEFSYDNKKIYDDTTTANNFINIKITKIDDLLLSYGQTFKIAGIDTGVSVSWVADFASANVTDADQNINITNIVLVGDNKDCFEFNIPDQVIQGKINPLEVQLKLNTILNLDNLAYEYSGKQELFNKVIDSNELYSILSAGVDIDLTERFNIAIKSDTVLLADTTKQNAKLIISTIVQENMINYTLTFDLTNNVLVQNAQVWEQDVDVLINKRALRLKISEFYKIYDGTKNPLTFDALTYHSDDMYVVDDPEAIQEYQFKFKIDDVNLKLMDVHTLEIEKLTFVFEKVNMVGGSTATGNVSIVGLVIKDGASADVTVNYDVVFDSEYTGQLVARKLLVEVTGALDGIIKDKFYDANNKAELNEDAIKKLKPKGAVQKDLETGKIKISGNYKALFDDENVAYDVNNKVTTKDVTLLLTSDSIQLSDDVLGCYDISEGTNSVTVKGLIKPRPIIADKYALPSMTKEFDGLDTIDDTLKQNLINLAQFNNLLMVDFDKVTVEIEQAIIKDGKQKAGYLELYIKFKLSGEKALNYVILDTAALNTTKYSCYIIIEVKEKVITWDDVECYKTDGTEGNMTIVDYTEIIEKGYDGNQNVIFVEGNKTYELKLKFKNPLIAGEDEWVLDAQLLFDSKNAGERTIIAKIKDGNEPFTLASNPFLLLQKPPFEFIGENVKTLFNSAKIKPQIIKYSEDKSVENSAYAAPRDKDYDGTKYLHIKDQYKYMIYETTAVNTSSFGLKLNLAKKFKDLDVVLIAKSAYFSSPNVNFVDNEEQLMRVIYEDIALAGKDSSNFVLEDTFAQNIEANAKAKIRRRLITYKITAENLFSEYGDPINYNIEPQIINGTFAPGEYWSSDASAIIKKPSIKVLDAKGNPITNETVVGEYRVIIVDLKAGVDYPNNYAIRRDTTAGEFDYTIVPRSIKINIEGVSSIERPFNQNNKNEIIKSIMDKIDITNLVGTTPDEDKERILKALILNIIEKDGSPYYLTSTKIGDYDITFKAFTGKDNYNIAGAIKDFNQRYVGFYKIVAADKLIVNKNAIDIKYDYQIDSIIKENLFDDKLNFDLRKFFDFDEEINLEYQILKVMLGAEDKTNSAIDVGVYDVTFKFIMPANDKYKKAPDDITVKVTINKAIVEFVFKNKKVIYNGQAQPYELSLKNKLFEKYIKILYDGSDQVPVDVKSDKQDVKSYEITYELDTTINSDNLKIVITRLDGKNVTDPVYYTIEPKVLEVELEQNEYDLEGFNSFVLEDNIKFIGDLSIDFSIDTEASDRPGTYTFTIAPTRNYNYTIVARNNTFKVGRKEVDLEIVKVKPIKGDEGYITIPDDDLESYQIITQLEKLYAPTTDNEDTLTPDEIKIYNDRVIKDNKLFGSIQSNLDNTSYSHKALAGVLNFTKNDKDNRIYFGKKVRMSMKIYNIEAEKMYYYEDGVFYSLENVEFKTDEDGDKIVEFDTDRAGTFVFVNKKPIDPLNFVNIGLAAIIIILGIATIFLYKKSKKILG